MNKNIDIAVIGINCYYPGAADSRLFWHNILAKRQQFRNLPDCRLPLAEYWNKDRTNPDTTYGTKAALIDNFIFDWQKRKIPKTSYESSDIVHWLSLETALGAIKDASIDLGSVAKDNIGVIVGNSLTGEFTRSENLRLRWPFINKVLKATAIKFGWNQEQIEDFTNEMELIYKSVFAPVTEDTLAGGLSNTIAGRICNFCDFHGGGYVVDGACSSSLLSVITAANALANNQMDIAIAGGVDISLDPFELVGFSKAGALTDSEMKVYDENRSGFIPGEGCGFVVLKRLEDAVKNNDRIYATIKGWGISSDGSGGITAPNAKGQSMAIIRALTKANISPDQINFIEGHGTGTFVGDTIELEGINLAFKHFNVDQNKICGITSVKSLIGHTKAAAGIAAFIKTVIALNQRIIPPIATINNLHPLLKSDNFPLYAAIKPKKYPAQETLNAGVSSMGFGGINAHITLSSASNPDQKYKFNLSEEQLSSSTQNSEVIIFSATDQNDLINQLTNILEYIGGIAIAELADFAKYMSDLIDIRKPLKAAIVVKNPDELYQKISAIIGFLKTKEISPGLMYKDSKLLFFVGYNVETPKIGFLFPGQGSQKINSGSFLIDRFPLAKEIQEKLDTINGRKISDEIYPETKNFSTNSDISYHNQNLSKSQIAQPAVILSSLLWLNFLNDLGIKAKAIGGHSLGELMALYDAGAYDLESLLKITCLRGKIMGAVKSEGKMASLMCDADKTSKLIANIDGVVIANFNSPEQTVISGDANAIMRTIDLADKQGIIHYVLPVSNAFHSPLMQEAAYDFKSSLMIDKVFTSRNQDNLFFSSLYGKKIDDQINVRDHLTSQIISSVRFVDMINEMLNEVDYFIEVGPGNVLSKLVTKIADDKIQSYPVEKTAGDFTDINCLLADLYVRNLPINWEALYQNRLIYPFIQPNNRNFIVNPLEKPLTENGHIISNNFISNQITDPMAKNQEINIEENNINQVAKFSLDLIQKNKRANPQETEIKSAYLDPNNITPVNSVQNNQDSYNIEEMLIDTVFDITGFSKSSINLTHKLLSDLNLDSIKSATLITRVARKLNIDQSSINPSSFSNATLQEIKNMFESKTSNQTRNTNVETKVDNQKKHSSWLKYFAIKDFEEPIEFNYHLNQLSNRQITVLGWGSSKWQKDFLWHLDEFKLQAKFFDITNRNDFSNIDNNHLILIIPTLQNYHQNFEIKKRVTILSEINKINFSNLLSLTVIHFDSEVESFFASIHHEYPTLKVNLINVDEDYNKKHLVAIINDELNSKNQFNNSRYQANSKYTKRPSAYTVENFVPRNIEWTEKDVIIVTGGAKGITNECIFEWSTANKIRSKLVLIGRSTGSDAELKKMIKKFQDHQVNCYYYSCDITNSSEIRKTIDLIRNNLGNITGLVHGAGSNNPRLFKDINHEEAFLEISPKVIGLNNILELLNLANLKIITAMSSIIGYTGMPGNAWYAWSNKVIENLILKHRQQNPNIQACIIGYSIWDEVGMGFRMGSVEKLASSGIAAISKNDGVESFSKLMSGNLGVDKYIVTSRLGNLDSWNPLIPPMPEANRFLEKIIYFEPLVELICESHLTLEKDLYLQDHNFQGSILFPTVFGLEAMAQAVAYTVGIKHFDFPIEINNIDLNKPIVIDQKHGLRIQTKVLVKNRNHILVSISTEESNFTIEHFKAEFRLDKTSLSNIPIFNVANQPLNLNPKQDFYGSLLFQGPMFQKIGKIYNLSASEIIYDVVDTSNSKSFRSDLSSTLILGNPFMRDVLLQSAQLQLPSQRVLPIKIEKIAINSIHHQNYLAKNLINAQDGRDIKLSVAAINNQTIVEYMQNYVVREVGEITKINLTAQDIIDPSNYDQQSLNRQLESFATTHDLELPTIELKYLDNLIQFDEITRRAKEEPIFKAAIRNLLTDTDYNDNIEIKWNILGKPYAILPSNQNYQAPHISLTHNDKLCVAIAAKYLTGCDIERITARPNQEWQDIIANQSEIWQNISAKLGNDAAGTVVWTIKESIAKSGIINNLYKLSLVINDQNVFLFTASDGDNNVLILSTIFDSLRSGKVAFSCIVNKKTKSFITKESASPSPTNSNTEIINNIFTCKKRGDYGENIYIHRFRTTFRDANNVDRTLCHPIFATWMGQLRELPLDSIASELIYDMTSGKWGMVTNNSYIKIVGEASALDLIEGHFWVNKVYGKYNSTIDLAFKWYKVNNDGSLSIIAYSFLPTTWVKVVSHGVVEVHPFPDYFKKWVDDMVATKSSPDYLNEITNYPQNYEIGNVLFKDENLINQRRILHKATFSTSLDESNLVGNIYYANYYKWQAKTFDYFIHKINPGFFFYQESQKKFVCLESEINHLQEAMPFDTIEVRLYVDEVYEFGLGLIYEFFRIVNDDFVKIAWGKQKIVLTKLQDSLNIRERTMEYIFQCFANKD